MQTLFDSSGLEKESLSLQRLRRRRSRRKERISKGGEEGGVGFESGSGYQGDSGEGGWLRGDGRVWREEQATKRAPTVDYTQQGRKEGTCKSAKGGNGLFWKGCTPNTDLSSLIHSFIQLQFISNWNQIQSFSFQNYGIPTHNYLH